MPKSVTILYGKGDFLTGQQVASELLIDGLDARGWHVTVIQTPLQYRTAGQVKWLTYLQLGVRLLLAWARAVGVLLRREPLNVNLGQTKFALLRDGLPILMRSLWPGDALVIISLHGNLFLEWPAESLQARLMRCMAATARYVTVLGQLQVAHLRQLGIPAEKIIQIDNTCLLSPLSREACVQKQAEAESNACKILFLSNLLESKGYPEFVEAVQILANRTDVAQYGGFHAEPSISEPSIEVTLCGQLIQSADNRRFATVAAAQSWLEAQVAQINQSQQVRMRWLTGVWGETKNELFRQAHLFVLPSKYRVEAQPIVVLEALASGCAIITTKVGELPTTVSPATAILLDAATPAQLADAMQSLAQDHPKRLDLGLRGLDLFNSRFSHAEHLQRWEMLLNQLSGQV